MSPTLQKILALTCGVVIGTCSVLIVRTTQTVKLMEQQVNEQQITNEQLSYIVSDMNGETR